MMRHVSRALLRVQRRWRGAAFRAIRFTGAAAAAYVVADLLLADTVPVIAALTALLVVEATLSAVLLAGVQRVVSVMVGVLLAVAFSSLVGISWWSLGLLVGASIVAGQLLRLGPQLVEVPISAMLVLAVGGEHTVASDRVVETIIGAAVGVAVNIVFPPRIRSATAAATVGTFADEITALLGEAAEQLRHRVTSAEADRWLESARRLSRHVPRMDRALAQAEQSRRLNPRALAQRNTTDVLRGGLEALEHSSVAVRSMFRSIADGVRDTGTPEDDSTEAVQHAFSTLLAELADAVHAYGDLVRAEVSPATGPAEAAAAAALAALREARVRVIELRTTEHPEQISPWGLDEAVLQAVNRILAELDVDKQAQRRGHDRYLAKARPQVIVKAVQQRLHAATDEPGRTKNSDRRQPK